MNAYKDTYRNDEDRAQYEKRYVQYLALPEPKVTDVNLNVDLDPKARTAEFSGTMQLQNKTGAPIDRVAITIWPEDLAPFPVPLLK